MIIGLKRYGDSGNMNISVININLSTLIICENGLNLMNRYYK